jgi:nicotinate-nucleotide adenylyltransferase
MTPGRKIGIMGGTFDPPHLGHILPVEIAAAEFDLDWVWFIPAFIPPHKQDQKRTNPFHRTAMLALALKNFPQFRISPLELLRADVSFTVDTIRELQSQVDAQDRLYFIMGSDSFLEIHTWYSPATLFTSCDFIVINRGDERAELLKNLENLESTFQVSLKQTVHFVSSQAIPFSSTEIRRIVSTGGGEVSKMIFPEVEAYIKKHCLYRR